MRKKLATACLLFNLLPSSGFFLVTLHRPNDKSHLPLTPWFFNCWICNMPFVQNMLRGWFNWNWGFVLLAGCVVLWHSVHSINTHSHHQSQNFFNGWDRDVLSICVWVAFLIINMLLQWCLSILSVLHCSN